MSKSPRWDPDDTGAAATLWVWTLLAPGVRKPVALPIPFATRVRKVDSPLSGRAGFAPESVVEESFFLRSSMLALTLDNADGMHVTPSQPRHIGPLLALSQEHAIQVFSGPVP